MPVDAVDPRVQLVLLEDQLLVGELQLLGRVADGLLQGLCSN